MKIRAVVALGGLAISFTVPTFAQEKEEANSFPFRAVAAGPQLIEQLEAVNLKFDEAFNKHDAAAVGALYIPNAVQVTPVGSFSGREAIEGYVTELFQRHKPTDRVTKISYVYAMGGDLCAIGGWTVTIDGTNKFGGYLVNVYTPVGAGWKIRASVFKYQAAAMTEPAPVFEDVARVITLASEAPLSAGDIASRAIFKSTFARIVLFRFSEGTELTEHTTPARVIVQILSGRCEFTAGSDQRVLAGGDVVYLPPNQPHSVTAVEAFSMLITMLNDLHAEAI